MGSFSRRNKFAAVLLSASLVMGGWPIPKVWAAGRLSAVWANEGGDKVAQAELRASANPSAVLNSVWDGTTIRLFGAKNEVVNFNLVLESNAGASDVSVSFNSLSGPGLATSVIYSAPASGDQLFTYVNRPIELFYIRYLQIKGVSTFAYENYDERHVPKRMRRPWTGAGIGSGVWADRPDHDAMYPDIAVPLELVPTFNIAAGQNQSIWGDIYIPKNQSAGQYHGTITIKEGGVITRQVPIQLVVRNFMLPDAPSAKTMLYYSSSNISRRYVGSLFPSPTSAAGIKARQIRDRHFLMAHRHKISLIGDEANDCGSSADAPCAEWLPRLNGSLFTSANGYDGPGVNTGNGVYSIGTYGNWGWKSGGQAAMNTHLDSYASWFAANAPGAEYFLYLADESADTAQMQTWAQYILNNTGLGRNVKSFATVALPTAASAIPTLDIVASTLGVGIPSVWQSLVDSYTSSSRKRFYMYNGHRPASGTFATEDDGVALREIPWSQFKKKINRWFFWESTYYDNFQGGMGQTNVFRTALTFGAYSSNHASLGQTGTNYTNGEGVLFYPGTDTLFPGDSYGVNGPFASLRLKYWRRGIQDVDYLTLAAAINPTAVNTLVNSLVPKVLWEYGVTDPSDPTWVRTDISWPINPDTWEAARSQLATLIEGTASSAPATPTGVTATAQNGKVTLAWNAVSGATSYTLYYRTGSGVTPSNGNAVSNVTSPRELTSLTNGQLYSFIVVASNNVGVSSPSPEVTATPNTSLPEPSADLPGQPVFTDLQGVYPMTGRIQARSSNSTRIHFTFTPRGNRLLGSAAFGVGDSGAVSAATPNGILNLNSVPGLAPGAYQVQAIGENSSGVSAPASADILLAMSDNNATRVFPNPWRSDRHSGPVTFDQMAANSTVKVFTLSGHLVRTLLAPTGLVTWDLENDSGDRVASGLYLYLITNDQTPKVRGKFAIIR